VFNIPKSLTTRNVGIIPPENNIVKIIIAVKTFLPLNLERDKGNAPAIVNAILSKVPTTV